MCCDFRSGEFSIWTREAGAGGLSIAVEGPSKAEITFEDRKDGSCGVSYVVQEPGETLLSSATQFLRCPVEHQREHQMCLFQVTMKFPSNLTMSTSQTHHSPCPSPRWRTTLAASPSPACRYTGGEPAQTLHRSDTHAIAPSLLLLRGPLNLLWSSLGDGSESGTRGLLCCPAEWSQRTD